MSHLPKLRPHEWVGCSAIAKHLHGANQRRSRNCALTVTPKKSADVDDREVKERFEEIDTSITVQQ
jgi:hypothetical protein